MIDRPHPPTRTELSEIGEQYNISLTDKELDFLDDLANEYFEDYRKLQRTSEPESFNTEYERSSGSKTGQNDDPYNIFVTKCHIDGANDGPLTGYTIGLKDNISVAGVEMTCGSSMLEGFIPDHDAPVVSRLLDAGASIIGKTTLPPFCLSSLNSEYTHTGPVRNPNDKNFVAGGSSSGSAAGVVTGDFDIALGTDQGGSIRLPAARCGCVGLKPTWGLVPYVGIQSMEDTLDTVGPLTNTVEECALVLDQIAGEDPRDPRQFPAEHEPESYVDGLTKDKDEFTVGMLSEGFEGENIADSYSKTISDAITTACDQGITVRDVSIPFHANSNFIYSAIFLEGLTMKISNNGMSPFTKGYYDSNFATRFGQARSLRANDFPAIMKAGIIVGRYLCDRYQGKFYAKAQNLRPKLTAAYDKVFEDVDVLALPTVGTKPRKIEKPRSTKDTMTYIINKITVGAHANNTKQFNLTGHPALSLPCGEVDGFPVGLQLVGPHMGESTLLNVAQTIEQSCETNS